MAENFWRKTDSTERDQNNFNSSSSWGGGGRGGGGAGGGGGRKMKILGKENVEEAFCLGLGESNSRNCGSLR